MSARRPAPPAPDCPAPHSRDRHPPPPCVPPPLSPHPRPSRTPRRAPAASPMSTHPFPLPSPGCQTQGPVPLPLPPPLAVPGPLEEHGCYLFGVTYRLRRELCGLVENGTPFAPPLREQKRPSSTGMLCVLPGFLPGSLPPFSGGICLPEFTP